MSDYAVQEAPNLRRLAVQDALPFERQVDHEQVQQGKPFLRWAGGKTRLLSALLPFVPPKFNNYHEPFLGSGAMFFALRHRARACFLADLNSELVNLWRVIKEEPSALFQHTRPYLQRKGEDEYYVVRSESPDHHLERAARFLYLNQTAWNGLWRENRWGIFNVPYGARDFKGIDSDTLAALSRILMNVEVRELDFREAAKRTAKGDFIYFDPPYLAISDTSKFAGYNGTRFRLADLEELADLCKNLTKRGVHWMVGNIYDDDRNDRRGFWRYFDAEPTAIRVARGAIVAM